MSKRLSSTALRREAFNRHAKDHPFIEGRKILYCAICDAQIDPLLQVWELDHITPLAISGNNEPENLQIACVHCHKEKTKTDVTSIAKGKRMAEKHYGIKRSSAPMPCGRRSRWKKKLNGEVVPRE
jgi:5-methylcytosine-specific restriction protein A